MKAVRHIKNKSDAINILKLIGNTPLIRIEGIFAKMEILNPSGSIKDRMAWYMVKKAEQKGQLEPGDKIIEVTSGNTGISFAMISAIRGYEFIAIMPEFVSIEKRKIMKMFGAKVVLTPAKENMIGAVKKYKEIINQNPTAWLPKQFENPDNIKAYKEGLGEELIKQSDGRIDAFVAGVGTGGTLLGVAQALKERKIDAKIIAVEPEEAAILSGGSSGPHRIEGIGEGFIPKLIKENLNLIDEVITISSEQAIDTVHKIAKNYGILVGVSSGANVLASKRVKEKYRFKYVYTVLPDRGERYLYEPWFSNRYF